MANDFSTFPVTMAPVSYTHLDVYKRQTDIILKSFFQIQIKNLRVREKSDLAQNISAIKERMYLFAQEQKKVCIVIDVYKRQAQL